MGWRRKLGRGRRKSTRVGPPWDLFRSGRFDDLVLAGHQTARIVLCRDMAKLNVVGQGAEERDSVSDENGHAGDDEALNQSRTQELLNCDSAVDIEMVRACCREFRDYLGWRPSHLFHHASDDR